MATDIIARGMASGATDEARIYSEKAEQSKVSAAESAETANAAKVAAETAKVGAESAAQTAVEKSQEISASAEQITQNKADIAELYNDKADGIVCESEGTDIVLNDSSALEFRGMRIFGQSTQDGTPSPTNPAPIVSVGDNGEVNLEIGNSGYCMRGSYFDKVQMIPLKKGMRYRLNYGDKSGGNVYNSFILNEIKNFSNSNRLYSYAISKGAEYIFPDYNVFGECRLPSNKNADITITICIEGLYYYQAVNGTEENNDNFQMWELPSNYCDVPAEYQPLTVSTPNGLPGIPVPSGGNYTDSNGRQWICDEVDFVRGVYVQRVYEQIFNGTEKWEKASGIECSFFRVSALQNNMLPNFYGLCDKTKVVSYQLLGSGEGYGIAFMYYWRCNFAECDANNGATVDDFKAFLTQNPMRVLYAGVATERPLTAEEIAAYKALHTNKPTTTIANSDNAHMAVSYTADTKTYIDNKFNELATAVIATGGNV